MFRVWSALPQTQGASMSRAHLVVPAVLIGRPVQRQFDDRSPWVHTLFIFGGAADVYNDEDLSETLSPESQSILDSDPRGCVVDAEVELYTYRGNLRVALRSLRSHDVKIEPAGNGKAASAV